MRGARRRPRWPSRGSSRSTSGAARSRRITLGAETCTRVRSRSTRRSRRTRLIVIGHYDPSLMYYIRRKGWMEDPYLWTPFDEAERDPQRRALLHRRRAQTFGAQRRTLALARTLSVTRSGRQVAGVRNRSRPRAARRRSEVASVPETRARASPAPAGAATAYGNGSSDAAGVIEVSAFSGMPESTSWRYWISRSVRRVTCEFNS